MKRLATLLVLALAQAGCLRHHLVHPAHRPEDVASWQQDSTAGQLRVHLEWAGPQGSGPFPTVLVHPEAGKTARQMRGVIWDLAQHGYLAVAADYERQSKGGHWQHSLFAWHDRSDPLAALQLVLAEKRVDRERVALMGFSQGGVFSLVIAAQAHDDGVASIKAVVAYYPITDFELWLSAETGSAIRRFVWRRIRHYFFTRSGARDEDDFRAILRRASPIDHVESIDCPVLLIHGQDDTTAPIEESLRLAERLASLGKPVELLAIPHEGHVFNFKHRAAAAEAWRATLSFLDAHLTPGNRRP